MKPPSTTPCRRHAGRSAAFRAGPWGGNLSSERGSVLIIVLWITIGLVSVALYFANSMNYELTAADNRVNGLSADQAIEGAARYVSFVLQNFATNGSMPDPSQYKCAAVPVGNAKFWIIGRDPSAQTTPTQPVFGLIDEGGKLNLNNASTNALEYLPNMTTDFANAIMDWRGTNGDVSLDYASMGYNDKNLPFETIDELRLVYGADEELLVGDDLNRNGVLDKNEKSSAGGGEMNSGLLEYVTVYTREPNFLASGAALTNVSNASDTKIRALLQNNGVSTSYVNQLTNRTYVGMLAFALRCKNAGMSTADFATLYPNITTTTNSFYIRGRINVNTASADVLTALFMGITNTMDQATAESAADTLVSYREQNPEELTSIAWVIDALGSTSPIITALATYDSVTTRSYQFTADVAAVGAFGRGYRRVKFIFDMSNGSPIILYRQDLSRLGWALGDQVHDSLAVNNATQ